jgi:hypothetical protein
VTLSRLALKSGQSSDQSPQAKFGWTTFPPHADLAIHVFVFVVLAWWSWRKWPDPLIDFGRELYVPWQITQGKVHIATSPALKPLSPYVNALLPTVGIALTLAICNMAIFAMTVLEFIGWCAYQRTASPQACQLSHAVVFDSIVPDVGNYNFISPLPRIDTARTECRASHNISAGNRRTSRVFWR